MTAPLSSNPLRAVLFDLDGTLLDSFPAHFNAYRVLFAHFGIQVSEESFLAAYSPNWLETYQRVGLPREQWAEADRIWLAAAQQERPELFPGAADVLARLGDRFRLGLVTSGSRERVLGDLRRTGIHALFEVIITGGEVQRPKPDPHGLHLALGAMRLDPRAAVYVGDAQADYEMSMAGGVRFIGVSSRFASLKPETPCPQLPEISALLDLLDAG